MKRLLAFLFEDTDLLPTWISGRVEPNTQYLKTVIECEKLVPMRVRLTVTPADSAV